MPALGAATAPEPADLSLFSPTDLALTGFRTVREHPQALIGWSLLQFALTLGSALILSSMAGPSMAKLQAVGFKLFADPTAIMSFAQAVAPAEEVLMVLSLILGAVFAAAMIRTVLAPQDSRFSYLRLGFAELRQLGLRLVFIGFVLGASIIVSVVLGGVTALAGALGSAGAMMASLILFAGTLAIAGGLVFAAVRLSVAGAMTFDLGRISVVGAWRLTRGQFWPILATLAAALGLAGVVFIFGSVFVSSVAGLLASALAGAPTTFQPDYSSVAAVLQPAELAAIALTSVLNALIAPILMTPAAEIYQRLRLGANGR